MIKDNNLSNSSLKVIGILKALMLSPMSGRNLCENFSNDTLNIYFNTLEKAGIKISSFKKPHRYFIKENINFIDFSDNDFIVLSEMKKIIGQNYSVKNILSFNNSLEKLKLYTNKINADKIDKIIAAPPFGSNLHAKIISLQNYIVKGESISIYYRSPKSGREILRILPLYLKTDNTKLYLFCLDNKLSEYRCLKVTRIEKIKSVSDNISEKKGNYYAICEIKNYKNIQNNFLDIQLIKKEKSKVLAKINYSNRFVLFQKLISLGCNCKIIEPAELKNTFYDILKSIKELYE